LQEHASAGLYQLSITYAFGLEEHLYGATGINTGNTYYYNLGGRLIGALTGITTLTPQFFLTDALGSVLATFSATAGSAAVLGNQVYGPYGNQRYTQGSMGTAKGYTGQYADATGLDYYNARYYDPIVGLFVSADIVQGNEQGMDPYAYVAGNPETMNDPTGHLGWGFAAIALPIVASAVGLLALGVLIVGASPLLATVALGAAVGVVAAGAISYMSYADAHGGWGSPFNTDQSLDDWGKRALLAEVIGGVAAWVGMAAGPGVAAMFNAPNPEVVANGVGLIAGGTGGIIGQGISQTVFPSHPQQQPQSKLAPA
jgi:RHS repeat-associated protein